MNHHLRKRNFSNKFIKYIKSNIYPISLLLGFFVTLIILTSILVNIVWVNALVRGKSMQPNFYNGDRVFASKSSPIKRGDIIIIDPPGSTQHKLFIKRVIGLPGDTISSKDDTTYINGKPINEPYLDPYKTKLPEGSLLTKNFSLHSLFGINHVPKNSYFVMGDNRQNSVDSRTFDAVPKDHIIGVVKSRFWPLTRFTVYK